MTRFPDDDPAREVFCPQCRDLGSYIDGFNGVKTCETEACVKRRAVKELAEGGGLDVSPTKGWATKSFVRISKATIFAPGVPTELEASEEEKT